jgi:hypothetical protein
MTHHAYFFAGENEEGIEAALQHAEQTLGLARHNNPDLIVFRHGLFSVDDARRISELAYRATNRGDQKAIVISATRLFHEAQNALLKVFEEPPVGTTLILVIPAEGMLLPTLRSRLMSLPMIDEREDGAGTARTTVPTTVPIVQEFFIASPAEREKLVGKLVDRTKSDKDEEKQRARNEAIQLVEGMIRAAHGRKGMETFLSDLDAFLPILHERSAPLKLIFEHILLVIPKGLNQAPI